MGELVDYGMATLMAVHAAVRRDLDRLVASTAAVEEGRSDPAGVAALGDYWQDFVVQFVHHHEVEDHELYVRIAEVHGGDAQGVLAAMGAEHGAVTDAVQRCEAGIGGLVGSPDPATAGQVRADLEALRQLTVDHLTHEEADCVPLLVTSIDEDYMGPFLSRRQADGDPAKFFPWMLDRAPDDAAALLVAPLPPPVQELIATQWRPARQRLIDALPA